MNINQLIRTGRVLTRSIPGQVECHCFAVVVFVHVWIKHPLFFSKLVSSMTAHAAFSQAPLSRSPSLC